MPAFPIRVILPLARALCKTPLGNAISDALIFHSLRPTFQKRLRSALNLVRIRERFRGGRYSWAWGHKLPFAYNAFVTAGPLGCRRCLRFEWRIADWDGTRRTMSAELFTGYFAPTDALYYSYRVFLPASCSDMAVPLILSQTHDMPDFHLGEVWRHPITDVCLQGGIIRYTYRASVTPVTPLTPDGKPIYTSEQTFSLGRAVFDAWNYLSVREHLSPCSKNGNIRVQLNDVVVARDGIHIGYNDDLGPFWKFGPYLPVMERAPDQVVLFYDRITVGFDKRIPRVFRLQTPLEIQRS
jgi:hypothetical protein